MKKIITMILATVIAGMLSMSAAAVGYNKTPYYSYEYNSKNDSVSAPAGYICEKEILSNDLGLQQDFGEINDILFKDQNIYILDSGNSRIIVLNKRLSLETIYNDFTDEADRKIDFKGSKGFTIDDSGNIYIADTLNTRVLVFNSTHRLLSTINRPDDALNGYDNPFDVSKITVDKSGQIFVLADSINLGAMVFSQEGEFRRFFGSNEVQTTAEVILNSIKKRFMTQKQISAMKKYTPVSFSNFDMDKDNFLFTVTSNSIKTQSEIVRKLNYTGKNVLYDREYGDLEFSKVASEGVSNSFCDIDVDDFGFINLLDSSGGKVFQYSQDGQLVSVFGVYGSQFGSFSKPVAIESVDEKIIVLDAEKRSLMVFSPTDYAVTFRNAVQKLEYGQLDDSLKDWESLLDSNTNSMYAYYGMGMIYDKLGNYGEAMKYFKISGSNENYSNAFKQYRSEFVHDRPVTVAIAALLIFAVCFAIAKWYRKKSAVLEGTAFSGLETKKYMPLYTLLHPVDGFETFKLKKELPSPLSASLIVVLWFFAVTFQYFFTGFSFNKNDPSNYNLGITCVSTIVLFLVFVVGNWSVCTLFDGKGSFKEIYCVAGYSLIPYILSIFVSTALSNVLTSTESIFLSIIVAIGMIWTACILIGGLFSVHEFPVGKLLLFIVFTILAMVIIVFLAIVFYGLLQQAYNFVKSVIFEASLRSNL